MNVFCGNCGKDSGIERIESDGVNAANIQGIGWIPKLPVLLGIPEWLFTCSENCRSELMQRKCEQYEVTEETKAEAKIRLERFKTKIPQMAKQTGEFMNKVQSVLNKIPRKEND